MQEIEVLSHRMHGWVNNYESRWNVEFSIFFTSNTYLVVEHACNMTFGNDLQLKQLVRYHISKSDP